MDFWIFRSFHGPKRGHAEPEKVHQHCSNAVWKVNDLGGKLRAKGHHLYIVVSILFQINLFRISKYKFILKFTM